MGKSVRTVAGNTPGREAWRAASAGRAPTASVPAPVRKSRLRIVMIDGLYVRRRRLWRDHAEWRPARGVEATEARRRGERGSLLLPAGSRCLLALLSRACQMRHD